MDESTQKGGQPKGLVKMFAAEDRREQHGTLDRRTEKKHFTPRRVALGVLGHRGGRLRCLRAAEHQPVLTERGRWQADHGAGHLRSLPGVHRRAGRGDAAHDLLSRRRGRRKGRRGLRRAGHARGTTKHNAHCTQVE